MTASNGWYRLIEGDDLQQGDLLENVPVYLPKAYPEQPTDSAKVVTFEKSPFDVIVLTASCELAQAKTDSVLLCPHWDAAELPASLTKPQSLAEIDKGRRPRYCLLALSDLAAKPMSLRIIDFARTLSLPLSYVMRHALAAGPRLRMNSPYSEYVAQSFGMYHTRIGLPKRASDC